MRANVHNHVDVDRLTWGCDACTNKARSARREGERQAMLDDGDWRLVTITYDVNIGTVHSQLSKKMKVPKGFDGEELMDFIEGEPFTSGKLADELVEHALDSIDSYDMYVDRWHFEVGDVVSAP